jgi:long-chain acyl-CoA synthetase
LSEALLENWQTATDSIVIEGYGQTEAGPVISFNPVNGVRKVGSVGVAVPGTEIEIVDVETGEDVLPNYTYGEIRLRGPQIMCGYRDLPEETAEAVRNGWLYTGDIGELDDEGYLFIRSRKKEMIIVSGFNVYPVEVEGVLSSHAAVTEVAVVGRDDAHSGEVPVAYVVIKNNLTVTEAELYDFCKENLTKYKIPRKFYFIDAIPKTSVGKIDKLTLKKSANDSKSEIS